MEGGWGGGGAKSTDDGEKAWSSIINSILSAQARAQETKQIKNCCLPLFTFRIEFEAGGGGDMYVIRVDWSPNFHLRPLSFCVNSLRNWCTTVLCLV